MIVFSSTELIFDGFASWLTFLHALLYIFLFKLIRIRSLFTQKTYRLSPKSYLFKEKSINRFKSWQSLSRGRLYIYSLISYINKYVPLYFYCPRQKLPIESDKKHPPTKLKRHPVSFNVGIFQNIKVPIKKITLPVATNPNWKKRLLPRRIIVSNCLLSKTNVSIFSSAAQEIKKAPQIYQIPLLKGLYASELYIYAR